MQSTVSVAVFGFFRTTLRLTYKKGSGQSLVVGESQLVGWDWLTEH